MLRGMVMISFPTTCTYWEEKQMKGLEEEQKVQKEKEFNEESPDILEEIEIEDLTVDGICGVY
jgi:mycofactocin precursor